MQKAIAAQTLQQFQSTSPVWRTTRFIYDDDAIHIISIHVPRVEDDKVLQAVLY